MHRLLGEQDVYTRFHARRSTNLCNRTIATCARARSRALCLDTVRLQVITHSCAWVSTCEPLVLWLATLHSVIRTVTQVFGDDYIFVPVHLHSGTIGVFPGVYVRRVSSLRVISYACDYPLSWVVWLRSNVGMIV